MDDPFAALEKQTFNNPFDLLNLELNSKLANKDGKIDVASAPADLDRKEGALDQDTRGRGLSNPTLERPIITPNLGRQGKSKNTYERAEASRWNSRSKRRFGKLRETGAERVSDSRGPQILRHPAQTAWTMPRRDDGALSKDGRILERGSRNRH